MSEGSSGASGPEQDPWSRPADFSEPGSAVPQPWPGQPDQTAPGGYPPPAGQYGYPPPASQVPRNNRAAIAALVCGLAQFILGLLIVGNIVLAIPAIICGALGLKQISRRGEGGRGMAIAGLVLGILGVVYFLIIIVVLSIIGMHLRST